jgi:hypothetical protein
VQKRLKLLNWLTGLYQLVDWFLTAKRNNTFHHHKRSWRNRRNDLLPVVLVALVLHRLHLRPSQ